MGSPSIPPPPTIPQRDDSAAIARAGIAQLRKRGSALRNVRSRSLTDEDNTGRGEAFGRSAAANVLGGLAKPKTPKVGGPSLLGG